MGFPLRRGLTPLLYIPLSNTLFHDSFHLIDGEFEVPIGLVSLKE